MKYCRICGKALSDDAVFCTACGQQCREEEAVPVQPVAQQPMPQQPVYQPVDRQSVVIGTFTPVENPVAPQEPKKSKGLWIAIAAAVVAVGLGIFFLSGGFVKRVKFPNPVTEENIQDFWNVVIENAGEECDLVVAGLRNIYIVPSGIPVEEAFRDVYGVCVSTTDFINGPIKLNPGHISVDIRGNFPLPEKDSLQEGKALYERTRNIIIAFEETISGQSRAGRFLKSYSKTQDQISKFEIGQNGKWETEEETYMLNDKWEVNIMISRTARDWYLSYYIKIIP